MTMFLSQLELPLGAMLLLTGMQPIMRALDFADHKARLHRGLREHHGKVELAELSVPVEITGTLADYCKGELGALQALRTATAGPELRRWVWAALRDLPAGTATTCAKLAKAWGFDDPRAAIDIGAANGANPIAIIVPCHWVIASNGGLKGHARGLRGKCWLLEHEKAMMATEKEPEPQTAMLLRG